MKSKHSIELWSIRELPALVFLILAVAALWIKVPSFRLETNLLATAREMAIAGIMGCGMTMVIITSGIDLSVGSILAVSSVVMARLMVGGTPVWLAVLAALVVGLILGLLNAVLINRFRVPPIITTLGTMGILRAGATLFTHAKCIAPLPRALDVLSTGYVPLLMFISIAAISTIFLTRTRQGRYVYAVGGNEEAARLSGVTIARTRTLVYALNGLLASVSGLIIASSMSSAQSNMATGYELNVIAAVVIGGTSIAGGQGSVQGTMIGAAIMAVLYNALILTGVPIHWHKVIIGGVILTAVLFDKMRSLRRK